MTEIIADHPHHHPMWLPRACALLLVQLIVIACAPMPPSTPEPVDAYPYDVFLPDAYGDREAERFPLILFLHGGGGLIPEDHLIPGFLRGREDLDFVVVAPITNQRWSVPRLDALLRDVQSRYRLDPDRVYLTGLSMGAFGAFALAAGYPHRFAALALVAGGGDPTVACTLRHLPVWLFHNHNDDVVPASASEQVAEALRRCGSERVRLTLNRSPDPDIWAHNAWIEAYQQPDLYHWFLQHRRETPPR